MDCVNSICDLLNPPNLPKRSAISTNKDHVL